MKKTFICMMVTLFIIGITVGCAAKNENKEVSTTNKEASSVNDQEQKKITVFEGTKSLPVDEAGQNPDFKAFRDELINAVKNKDAEFLKKHVSNTIRYTFGAGAGGFDGLMEYWNEQSKYNNEDLWTELGKMLALGGSFDNTDKTSFTAPYVFSKFPQGFDGFEYVAVIDKNVKVYSKPDINSEVLGEYNYNVVKLSRNKEGYYMTQTQPKWWMVETPSKTVGYVQEQYIRSPIDYRASFVKENGVWKMNFFVAGD